jgi:hypothetical protein
MLLQMRQKIFFNKFWIHKIFFYEQEKNLFFIKLSSLSFLLILTTVKSWGLNNELLIICQPNLRQLKNQNTSPKHIFNTLNQNTPNFNDPMLQRGTRTKLPQKCASYTDYFEAMQIYIFHIVMQRILHCNFYFMSNVVSFNIISNNANILSVQVCKEYCIASLFNII